jgi:hypothetical protein
MADIPETQLLGALKSKIETEDAAEALFVAALGFAHIQRKPLYSPEEAYRIGMAITEASYEVLRDTLGIKPPAKS